MTSQKKYIGIMYYIQFVFIYIYKFGWLLIFWDIK